MFVVQKVYTAPSLFFLGNHVLLSLNNQSNTRLEVMMTLVTDGGNIDDDDDTGDDNDDVGESPIDLA